MSDWGVFEAANGMVHVMPVDEKRYAIGGHAVSDQCWCKPKVEKSKNMTLVIHYDLKRGGCNA